MHSAPAQLCLLDSLLSAFATSAKSPRRLAHPHASIETFPRAFSLRRRRCGDHSPSHLYTQAALLLHWNISPPCVLPPPQAVRESQPLSPARPNNTFAALKHSPRAFSLRRRRCGNRSPLTYTPKRRFCCIETCNKYRNMSKSKHLSFVCTVSRHPNCVLSQTKCVGI